MEAAEDSSGWGCCGLKTGSITNDGMTECKSLDPSWLQPQPGCLEASSAQGLHERFPSWLQPQPGRHGGKLCPGSPWEVPLLAPASTRAAWRQALPRVSMRGSPKSGGDTPFLWAGTSTLCQQSHQGLHWAGLSASGSGCSGTEESKSLSPRLA